MCSFDIESESSELSRARLGLEANERLGYTIDWCLNLRDRPWMPCPVHPVLRKVRQEDLELETSLGLVCLFCLLLKPEIDKQYPLAAYIFMP